MNGSVAAGLLALAPLLLAQPAERRLDPRALLAAFAERDHESDLALGLSTHAGKVLVPLARESNDPEAVLGRFEEELDLPREAAEPLLHAVLLEDSLRARQCDCPDEYERVLDELGRAWAAAPDAEPVVDALGWVLVMGEQHFPDAAARLAALAPEGARSAQIALAVGRLTRRDPASQLLWKALSEEPDNVAVLSVLAGVHDYTALSLVLREAAAHRLFAREPPIDSTLARAVASEWVATLLELGLAREALAACAELPAEICRQVRGGPEHETLHVSDDGLPFEARIRSLRRPLAAARLLTGDTRGAAEWLAEGESTGASFVGAGQERVLEEVLGRTHAGAFDLTLTLSRASGGWLSILDNAVWTRLACRLAIGDGLPEIARMYAGRSRQMLTWREGLERVHPSVSSSVPTELALRSRAFSQALREVRDGLESECGLEPDEPAPSLDAARGLIRAYLDSPPEPFAVWGWRDAASLRREPHEWPRDPLAFRALRSGDQVVAIGTTRLLPGAPPAGKWVLRPGGASGTPLPLYTGLPSSALGPHCPPPTFSGDRLTVSVLEAADELSLTPSRARDAAPPCHSHELLLADLKRDRDGDGLTDLAEETLFFTDPADPDTDGDGVPDGTDSLPQVPRQVRSLDRRSAAVRAFFDCLLGPPDGSDVDPEHRRAGVCRFAQVEPRSGVEPVYFVGRRSELTFLGTRTPVVVLEPDEYRELRQRRPERGLPPLRIDVLELDGDETRAILRWSGGNHSGELELTWHEGEWRIREISSTVS